MQWEREKGEGLHARSTRKSEIRHTSHTQQPSQKTAEMTVSEVLKESHTEFLFFHGFIVQVYWQSSIVVMWGDLVSVPPRGEKKADTVTKASGRFAKGTPTPNSIVKSVKQWHFLFLPMLCFSMSVYCI